MRTAERQLDYVFIGLAAALTAFGLVMLFSASGPVAYQKFGDSYWYLKHQLLFGLLPGLTLFCLTAAVDYRAWKPLAPWFLGFGVLLLILVFVPGLAADWSTSHSWIRLAGFSLQPAEIVKLALVVFLAAWFEERGGENLGGWRTGFLPFVTIVGAVAALIALQPDIGSLVVIAAAASALYFLAGAPWTHIGTLLAAGVAAFIYLIRSAPYRFARLMTFLRPDQDPQGIGYHINQAYLAIGSGGIIGLGLGHSRQKYLYLPEVVGDSIFAVMAEELGFVLMLAFLILVGAFLWRGLRIAQRAPDEFGRLLAGGVTAWIFLQTLFNVGSMLGLMPITGLPLPFLSYGGTALAVLLAAVGLLVSISRHAATESSRHHRLL